MKGGGCGGFVTRNSLVSLIGRPGRCGPGQSGIWRRVWKKDGHPGRESAMCRLSQTLQSLNLTHPGPARGALDQNRRQSFHRC